MRHVLRERQREAVLAITGQAASFDRRRLRGALLFALLAALTVLTAATVASASISPSSGTLTPSNTLSFSGQIEVSVTGFVVENPFGPFVGCATPQQFCESYQFDVTGLGTLPGTASFTFTSTNPNNEMDADVICNGDLMPRASANTTPDNPTVTVTFPVVEGDSCTIKISLFAATIPSDLTSPAGFSGTLSLTAATILEGGKV